jgi:uncharacterized protein YndB with AHSA1/START domain
MVDLRVVHTYAAAPELVFDAFLDPAVARRFLFATPTGEMIRAEVDARVGGKFIFVDRRPDMDDVLHTGEYLEIDRPMRLVFTFGVPQFSAAFSKVALDFARSPGGGCELALTQSDVAEEWAHRSREGWGMILGALDRALT